jgi:UDP-N-acetylglucosamine 2-epimerase (non-hydrolysing)
LKGILDSLLQVSEQLDIVFPVHPRTRQRIKDFGVNARNLHLLEPMPYIEFLALQRLAKFVITDSGGIQEETTYLGVPCLTLRSNTERPVTVTAGTNTLVGSDNKKLHLEVIRILEGKAKTGATPPLWDGHAGERIAEIVCQLCCNCNAGAQGVALV